VGKSVVFVSGNHIAVRKRSGIGRPMTTLWHVTLGTDGGKDWGRIIRISCNVNGQIVGPVKRCCHFPCLRCGNMHHLGVISGHESGSVAHAQGILSIGSV
jgi:hypothetical protein